jgi:hypothetical protein
MPYVNPCHAGRLDAGARHHGRKGDILPWCPTDGGLPARKDINIQLMYICTFVNHIYVNFYKLRGIDKAGDVDQNADSEIAYRQAARPNMPKNNTIMQYPQRIERRWQRGWRGHKECLPTQYTSGTAGCPIIHGKGMI